MGYEGVIVHFHSGETSMAVSLLRCLFVDSRTTAANRLKTGSAGGVCTSRQVLTRASKSKVLKVIVLETTRQAGETAHKINYETRANIILPMGKERRILVGRRGGYKMLL